MYSWSWDCLSYINSFSFFSQILVSFLIGFTFIYEIDPINKKIYTFLQFLITLLSNSFFLFSFLNAIVVCKETIYTGNITAHAFTDSSLKSSSIFTQFFLFLLFPVYGHNFYHAAAMTALSQQIKLGEWKYLKFN